MMTAKTSLPIVVCGLIFITSVLCVKEYSTNPTAYELAPSSTQALPAPLVWEENDPNNVNVVVLGTSLHDPMLSQLSEEYGVQHQELSNIWDVVVEETHEYSIDPFLMMALIQEESSYDKTARSRVGALGLTQVMPKVHHARLNRGEALTDVRVSVRVGVEVLNEYIQIEKGNIPRALQRYNGSLKDKNQRYARHILYEKSKLETLHIQSMLAQHNVDNHGAALKA